ncbi:MAG: YaiO family outer membrane beta-barrel protein, partial [Gammaproteobacteria bacterium]|nr:YaiO family outer membrane beta-barrel protein [Gammaproteobacteria bacterium]
MSRAGLILSGILAAIFSLPVDAELSSIALRLERTLVAQTSGEIGTLAEAKEAIDAKQFERAQALLEPIVAGRPNDEEARFLLARVLSWREQFAASLAQYDVLLGRSPGNADYLLGKAQVLYWSGRSADALPVITEARRLAPDYAAVWRLEIGVLAALGGEENLARARRLRQQAVARFPDQEFDPVVSDTGPGLRRNEIELAGSYDHLSDGRDAWRGISLRLSHDFSRRENVYAVVRGTDRFDQTDQELQIGGYLALADKWTFNYEATF